MSEKSSKANGSAVGILECDARLFRAAYVCASTEEIRYYVNGVYVEAHPSKGALLVATDGHRMMVIHDESARCTRSVIVRVDKAGLTACAPSKTQPAPRLVVGEDKLAQVSGVWHAAVNSLIDGNYPDWKRVIPVAGLGNATASFNGKYLGDFGRIAGMLKGDNKVSASAASAICVIGGKTAADPAVVLFPHTAFAFGMIMPMQADVRQEFPKWMLPVMNPASGRRTKSSVTKPRCA